MSNHLQVQNCSIHFFDELVDDETSVLLVVFVAVAVVVAAVLVAVPVAVVHQFRTNLSNHKQCHSHIWLHLKVKLHSNSTECYRNKEILYDLFNFTWKKKSVTLGCDKRITIWKIRRLLRCLTTCKCVIGRCSTWYTKTERIHVVGR